MKAAERLFPKQQLTQIFAALGDAPEVAVAVSGGGDSLALLRLLLQHRKSPAGITALTIDHALREESAREAAFVAQCCAALDLRHHTLRWQHPALTTGLQAKARAARYDLMAEFCHAAGIPLLLTGHTLEDQAETVSMRQRRTSSPKSLASIWPETTWQGLRILRPLLNTRRGELRTYLTKIGQAWLEDPSNANPVFERVRVRAEQPPIALAQRATEAQANTRAARHQAGTWLHQHLHMAETGMMRFGLAEFLELSPLAQDEALIHLITLAGGTPPERARRENLLAWLHKPGPQRRTLGGAIFARRKSDVLVMREPARIATEPQTLIANAPMIWDGRFHITGPTGSTVSATNGFKQLKRPEEIPSAVWQGLPLVQRGAELLGSWHEIHHPDVTIKFIKK